MKLTLPKPIPSWKDREHLFTPSNMTRLEFASLKEKVRPSSCNVKMRVKALPHGPVKHLLNRGMLILLTTEEQFFLQYNLEETEALLISKGPQLPEDRSGEPNQFYL